MGIVTVLGIDLACRRWKDNGSATLTFDGSGRGRRLDCRPGALTWPEVSLDAATLASAVHKFILDHGVAAVSLDGPQG